jgi:hypothetical protein
LDKRLRGKVKSKKEKVKREKKKDKRQKKKNWCLAVFVLKSYLGI